MKKKIPIFDFNKHKFDSEKHLMFPSDIIFNGEVQDFSGWSNIIQRIGEFGNNKHRFAEDLYSHTPIILTQSAINPEILFSQNEKILEILFEEYKCPRLLICSQALINLLSFNQSSGTVVDLGESGTQISTVIDGYTQYNDSIYNSFLSGRYLNLIYYYEKYFTGANNDSNKDMNKKKEIILDDFYLSYLDYFNAKNQREKQSNLAFYEKYFEICYNNYDDYNQTDELKKDIAEILFGETANLNNENNQNNNNDKKFNENKVDNNLEDKLKALVDNEFRCYDSFYFYPKFFRNIFSEDNNPFDYFEKEKIDNSIKSNDNKSEEEIAKKEYLLQALSMNIDSNLYQNLRGLLHASVGSLFPNREAVINIENVI